MDVRRIGTVLRAAWRSGRWTREREWPMDSVSDVGALMREMGEKARIAAAELAYAPSARKDAALRAAADDVTAAVADGAFGVGQDHGLPLLHFPLERTADAHAAVESGAVGKVLIDVAEA